MTRVRTIVGLFDQAAAAQVAVEHLLAAGFAPDSITVATQDTLRAQHLLPETGPRDETFEEGIVRFFMEVFTGSEAESRLYAAATHPASAVVAVNAASPSGADTARALLDTYGAVDVYKQAARYRRAAADRPTGIDLTGDPSQRRDPDQLDANGLTTH